MIIDIYNIYGVYYRQMYFVVTKIFNFSSITEEQVSWNCIYTRTSRGQLGLINVIE